MMKAARWVLAAIVLGGALLAGPATWAAARIATVEDAYAARQLRQTPFDPRLARDLAPEETRFLEELFALTDEAVLLGTGVRRWFFTAGSDGLHAADYLQRVQALRSRLHALDTPARAEAVRSYLAESLRLQRAFVAEWYDALENGRPFESQLTDEFGYHEGLHRSHRLLLKAYAELRALFPNAGEAAHRAFRDHLRAMDLP